MPEYCQQARGPAYGRLAVQALLGARTAPGASYEANRSAPDPALCVGRVGRRHFWWDAGRDEERSRRVGLDSRR